MASPAVVDMSPASSSSVLAANTLYSTVSETQRRSSSLAMDDSMVDYMSMMGREDRKRRFSEDVVDMEVKDSERLRKLYRQIQRQVHCSQENKGERYLDTFFQIFILIIKL